MKKLTLFLIFSAYVLPIFAQAPQGINYQGVARNSGGGVLNNTSVSVKFTIHHGTAGGNIVFEETQSSNTNQYGLFNMTIGAGIGSAPAFASIPWASGPKFLEVNINAGGTQLPSVTTKMLSVPYALYAENTKTSEIYIFEERYDHGLVPTTGSGSSPVGNTFNTRNLNTQVFPVSGSTSNVTIGGNGFLTFKPGIYLIEASAPAFYVKRHQLFLRRLDNTIDITGTSEYARNNNDDQGVGADQTRAFLKGVLTVPPGADRTVKLDHYIETSTYTPGGSQVGGVLFGIEHSQAGTIWNNIKEVYSTILIHKIQ